MAKEWIESLAQEIRQKNHEVAEEFGRAQHQSDVISVQGRLFFHDVVRALEDNFTQMRKMLQGDSTAAETGIMTTGATQAHLTRARFPWFDGHLEHKDPNVTFEYAKELGVPGDPALAERKLLVFAFQVDGADKLTAQDAFGDQPATYATPDDLARKITEILFAPA